MIESIANHPDNSDLASLRGLLMEREALIAAKDAELRNRDLLIEKLKHQLAGLQRHRFGTRAENLDQLALKLEDEEITQAVASGAHVRPLGPAEPADDRLSKAKRQPKRRPLPNHLPRHETVLSPGAACGACGGMLKRLGEDVTEELEYVPGHFVVNRIVRPRLACSGCEQIVQAELPSRPIERGRPGPGLLAHVLVGKYADHLPLYRQAQMFARDGVDLERSTHGSRPRAGNWPIGSAAPRRCSSRWRRRSAGIAWPARLFSLMICRSSCRRRGRARPKPRGSGPMSGTSGRGTARHSRRPTTGSRPTARRKGRPTTLTTLPAGCMPTAMPALRRCIAPAKSKKSPVW